MSETSVRVDRRRRLVSLAIGIPILLALCLAVWLGGGRGPVAPRPPDLTELSPRSAEALDRRLARHDYSWPPQPPVPALAVQSMPTGLAELRAERRKSLFFRSLLPLVLAENQRIRHERSLLRAALANGEPGGSRVAEIARRYGMRAPGTKAERERLLRRVDVVPPGLALAQAANESAWGTSRFAREGNNLFGVWTYDEDKGMVPRRRAPGAEHFVRRYPDLRASVRHYIDNLNTHDAYSEFRQYRAWFRERNRPLDPVALAAGLMRYSERGHEYVEDIRAMIRRNDLTGLANLPLASETG